MLLTQAALCFSANGLSVLLAILLLRDGWRFAGARIGAALFLCSIGYSLTLLPPPLRLPDPLYALAALANVPTLGLNLLFGRALLTDNFRVRRAEIVALIALSMAMFLGARPLLGMRAPGHELVVAILGGSGLIVMTHILWLAISGFREDLVEDRRRLRIVMVIFVLATYALVGVIELRQMSIVAEGIAFDASTLAITLAFLLWLTRLDAAKLFGERDQSEKAPKGPARLSHQSEELHRLTSALEDDEIWKDEGLTIGKLANRLGLAEHRLRSIINQDLGHKNFASFINGYRLEAAKMALGDRAQARVPILTIAMDAGFRSLSTFNRAFKTHEGLTPSAYRKRADASVEGAEEKA